MERGAGQLPPAVPPPGQQRKITQQQNDDVDLFSGHGITETRITDNFWFTAGYSYTTITNDLSGSRIYGTHWDEAFGEPVPTLGSRDHVAQNRRHLYIAEADDRLSGGGDGADFCRHAGAGASRDP